MAGKRIIGTAIAAVVPLVVLTGTSTASATTAAPVTRAATNYTAVHAARAQTAAVTSIPNNECWAVTANDGTGLFMTDAGLHNQTKIGSYNACFYFSENGSSFDGYAVYQMFINPVGADCEKIIHPDTVPAILSDQPCDDQHSGDPGESFIVFNYAGGGYGYVIMSIDTDYGSDLGVNSLDSGSVVEADNTATYRFWGLQCEEDC